MSNLATAVVAANEIVKATDFTFANDQSINNIAVAMQGILAKPGQDLVIGGMVKPYPSGGMNVSIDPVFAHCGNFDAVDTEIKQPVSIETAEQSRDRIDVIQIRGFEEFYDTQDRKFRDPNSKTETTNSMETKKRIKPEISVKKGTPGSVAAPLTDNGYVKLAEIFIPAGTVNITADNIKNISALFSGDINKGWTNQQTKTFNPGYLADLLERFLISHGEDGKLKTQTVLASMIKFGIENNDVNGRKIPTGTPMSIGETEYTSQTSITELLAALADVVDNNEQFSDEQFKTHKTATTLDHPDKSVTTSKINDKAVTNDKIADTTIATGKMASITPNNTATKASFGTVAITFQSLLQKIWEGINWLTSGVNELQSHPIGEHRLIPMNISEEALGESGYMVLKGQTLPIAQYQDLFNVMYCGDDNHTNADWWYKCGADGIRNINGTYFRVGDSRALSQTAGANMRTASFLVCVRYK
jgi:RNase H-fold protein (predicted Holliday junction resolvase)